MSTNTAPFTVQPKLTQIAMAIKPTGMIADLVCPRVTVPGEKFIYTKMNTDEAFTIPDTRVGRTGTPNQVEFGGVDVTDSTEDYGLDDPVPNKDIKNAEGTNYDPLAAAAERTSLLVQLAREQRVANLYFTLGTYQAALRNTLSGTGQWSDYANSDPVNAMLTMFDNMLIRPNIGVVGRAVWTKLRMHPKVVAAVLNKTGDNGGSAAAGVIQRQAIADLLELDDIFVGESFYNASKKGQTAGYSRLWGKHAAFMRIDKSVRDPRAGLPTFAFTAQWGDVVGGTMPDGNIGLDGGVKVRVGEHVKELVTFQDVGCFFQNAVA
jgi:hypothetical protein